MYLQWVVLMDWWVFSLGVLGRDIYGVVGI